MKIPKSLIGFLVLVILAVSWTSSRVLSSQAAVPEAVAGLDDSLNIEYVGHTGGEINTVILQGNYAYINEGASLTILDISLPGSVSFVGNSSLFPDYIGGIAISEGIAYIANRDSGLRVLDVSDPADPVEIDQFDTPEPLSGVALAGNYVYSAGWQDITSGGLRVLDVSVPASPVEVGFLEIEWTEDVVVSGNYAYIVRSMGQSLLVVDISDPVNPVEVGSYDPSAMSTAVAVVGDYAYLATFGYGMRVLDVSDPTNPTEIGIFNSTGSAVDITVQGDYAYLAEVNTPMGLRIVDVSDPTNPTEAGYHNTLAWAYGVAVTGDFAYVASSGVSTGVDSTNGLRVVNISNPASTSETDSYDVPDSLENVTTVDDHAYLTSQIGVSIVDVFDPAHPFEVGIFNTTDDVWDVAVQGSYAYVGIDGASPGMHVVNVSDPTNPNEVGYLPTTYGPFGVAVAGNYAYLTRGDLRVVDISDPTSPFEVGYLDGVGGTDVSVSGNYAYLARYPFYGIRVVDISNPTQPVDVGDLGAYSYYAPVVVGDYAYVAYGDIGLTVVDVTNPISPIVVGTYDTPGSAISLDVLGDYAYVADGESGLRMVDISDPTHPVEVGYFDTPGSVAGVSAESNLIYMIEQWDGSGLIILRNSSIPITTTTSILSDNPDPSLVSQPFTVTFGVTASLGIPTGVVTVTVSEGGEICSGELLDGQGSCQMALGTPGTHTLTADYAGEASFLPSSASELHTVTDIATITTLTRILSDNPDPSQVGKPFLVTFEVTSSLGIPSGMVTVTVSDSAETCSSALLGGLGACQLDLSSPGNYTLTAAYAGEGSFLPSSDSELHSVDMLRVHLPFLAQNHFLCTDFFDDFSDPSSGWFIGEDSDVMAQYQDGEYGIRVKPTASTHVFGAPTCDLENYSVEADARWAGNSGASYGLIFSIQGDFEQFYSFEVNSDYQEYALYRYDATGWTEIAPITYSPAILSGKQMNHLEATRGGDAITLEANGAVLGTWSDGTITGASYTGLIVSSYSDLANAEARFDNFSVTRLGSAASATTAGLNSELSEAHAQPGAYRQFPRQGSWQVRCGQDWR